uniref:Phenoloxidase-activating factor 2 n=1 Tax=Cotesia rubecula TaxID=32392 RepID=Q7Z1F0_COTRU|nr:venom protein Vn50 [Cotesia rubecula]
MKWKIFSIIFLMGLSSSQSENSDVTPPPQQAAPVPTTTNRLSTTGININTQENNGCECVNYYLCSNGTSNNGGVGVINIRLGENTCDNYLHVCCSPSNILDRDKRLTPKPKVHRRCGHRNFNGVGFRISGAENSEAEFGEFPWMVAVLVSNETSVNTQEEKKYHYKCGGSLIHLRAVLTAAHCLKELNSSNLLVRAGEWDTQTQSEPLPHQDRSVSRIIRHLEFQTRTGQYDLAILILSEAMEQAENVDIVCLPNKNEIFDNTRCVASGWGKNVFGNEGEYQVILKRVDLRVVDHAACQNAIRKTRIGEHFKLEESSICAGGEPGIDTCKGDGGSPLVCPLRNDPTRYSQAGIVSWGVDCGEDGVPAIYSNVAYAREWIDQQLEAFAD